MSGQHQAFRHIRVDELEERGLYQDRYSHDHHQLLSHNQNHQDVDSDIYDVYTNENNMGVMLLREKRYLDAANSFCQAVKFVNERSVFNCPRNDDSLSYNSLEYNNHNDDCRDSHRQSQSSPEPSLWSELDTPDMENSFSSTSSYGSDGDHRASPNNRIDSFYLLLDEDNGDDTSNDDNRSDDQSSLSSPSLRSDSDDTYLSTLQDDGTYMFRNPIIVTNRGAHPAASRTSLRPAMSTSTTNQSTESSTLATTTSVAPRTPTQTTRSRTENVTTIDKESCAKLSLVSVYNMALTYHLAALDSDKNGDTTKDQEKPNTEGTQTDGKKTNDVVTTHKDPEASAISSYVPAGPGTRDGTPRAKRRRSIDYNNSSDVSSTTTMTPFGECDTPYHDHDLSSSDDKNTVSDTDASNSSPNTDASNSSPNTAANVNSNNVVDRVLLDQALAYYEIAYRILVSEQRVLVSQAMVILNNIGHIHRLMGREENAKRCFQRLLTTMVYLQQTGDSNQISHWDRFLSNVIDLIVSPENSHKNYAPAA